MDNQTTLPDEVNNSDNQHETILLTWTRPAARTVSDAEIAAWYAAAMKIHEEAMR